MAVPKKRIGFLFDWSLNLCIAAPGAATQRERRDS